MTLGWRSGEPRSWTNFQEGRNLKINMKLPKCILGASNMSKTTKTPLRNLQCPHRLQGWYLDDVLENPGVGPLSKRVETWKLICSFLDVSLGHPPSQKPPRLLSGTSSVLLDSMMTLWRHIGDGALPRQVQIWKLICSFLGVSLGHPPCQKTPSPCKFCQMDDLQIWFLLLRDEFILNTEY